MKTKQILRTAAAVGTFAVLAASMTACTGGGTDSGKVTISFLTASDVTNATFADAIVKAFEEENPDITVKINTETDGSSSDNAIKTKLSTGTMDDVFLYNSGSLFDALNADDTLVNLSDQDWVSTLTDDFKSVVSTDAGLYGVPVGTSLGGGVMYNRNVYADLGLEVPTDWAEFISNSEAIKAAGISPVEQTYGDVWTSQIIILADFANIVAQEPDWADLYTANKAKYADEPALTGFEHLAELNSAGLLNEDFASATNADGLKAVAEGTAGQYPMLSSLISTIKQNNPDQIDDVGFFPLPADDASDTRLTVWQPSAFYIPSTTTGAKLDAAKKFLAFAVSKKGCELQGELLVPSGPFVTSNCTLPADVAPLLTDMEPYFESGATAPALEFLSPVKGPNLPNIAVEVGSGITSGKDGAARYDEDVKQQALQLGLEGW